MYVMVKSIPLITLGLTPAFLIQNWKMFNPPNILKMVIFFLLSPAKASKILLNQWHTLGMRSVLLVVTLW